MKITWAPEIIRTFKWNELEILLTNLYKDNEAARVPAGVVREHAVNLYEFVVRQPDSTRAGLNAIDCLFVYLS